MNYIEFKEKATITEMLNASAKVVYASNLTISQYRLRMWGAPMVRYALEHAGTCLKLLMPPAKYGDPRVWG